MIEPLQKLIRALSKLPSIGRRSAERIAMRLALYDSKTLDALILSLQEVKEQAQLCERCGDITVKGVNPCRRCRDTSRDNSLLCLVEEPLEINLIEKTGTFHGQYFCTLGKISPMNGMELSDERIQLLRERILKEGVKEVLIGFNVDVESDATACYIVEQLQGLDIAITRLPFGLPAGSALVYADALTLSKAIKGRQSWGK